MISIERPMATFKYLMFLVKFSGIILIFLKSILFILQNYVSSGKLFFNHDHMNNLNYCERAAQPVTVVKGIFGNPIFTIEFAYFCLQCNSENKQKQQFEVILTVSLCDIQWIDHCQDHCLRGVHSKMNYKFIWNESPFTKYRRILKLSWVRMKYFLFNDALGLEFRIKYAVSHILCKLWPLNVLAGTVICDLLV